MPVFRICGLAGLALAALSAALLARAFGLAMWVVALLWCEAVLAGWAVAVMEKLVRGREVLVYFHHQFAVLGLSWITLMALGQPALPYLDVAAISLGVFLACGRVGCFLAGCCHGRPHRWGIRYQCSHTEGRVADCLDEVRLLPVQLVESGWVVISVLLAILLRDRPGSSLSIYLGAYAAGRFWFEFLRGDAGRPYFTRLSEAQWTSLATLALLLALGGFGLLPMYWWQAAALLSVAAVPRGDRLLFGAAHVQEIAQALAMALDQTSAAGRLYIAETSLGLRISASTVHEDDRTFDVFSFSREGRPMAGATVRRLAALAARLRRWDRPAEVAGGNRGVYCVLIPQTGGGHAV